MHLGNPLFLSALLLIAIPIAIHLFLRGRPRLVIFPALRLLSSALAQGERKRRIRDRLLLAVRIALVGVLVLTLARPGCDTAVGAAGSDGPLACALIVDDSASMQYRPQFRRTETLLDAALAEARRHVADTPALGGAAFAVLTASAPDPGPGLRTDRAAVLESLAPNTAREHARPLGDAIRSAAEVLRTAGDARRRVVVFTDGAASAWRDVSREVLATVAGCEIDVVAVGPQSVRDVRLAASPPARIVSAATSPAARARAISTGTDVVATIAVRSVPDATESRTEPYSLPAGAARDVSVPLPARDAGLHAAALTIEPLDLLDADQIHYIVWQSGQMPAVWLLSGEDAPLADPTALLISSLLAPAGLPAAAQQVELVAASGMLPARPPVMVVALPDMPRDAGYSERIVSVVERGATLVLIPSDVETGLDWPGLRSLLSEDAPRIEALDSPAAIAAPQRSLDQSLGELARAGVHRRIRLGGLRAGVEVVARYVDDVPAIIELRLGRGRVVLLTTSPAPRWSDLGVRAAGLLTWLHERVDEAVGPPTGVRMFIAGERCDGGFATLPRDGVVSVVREDEDGAPVWRQLAGGQPREPWPTEQPGVYAIREGGLVRARYAVNWPDVEFELSPVTREALSDRLGTDRVRLVRSAEELASPTASGRGLGLNGVALAALAALALLLLESWLAATRGRNAG